MAKIWETLQWLTLFYFSFLLFVFTYIGGENVGNTTDNNNKLILILLDGFRWDYFRPEHVGFQRMFQEGVKADYLQPVFPSVSCVNWYSIVTGLYSENHGIVQNYMYDEHRNRFWFGEKDSDYQSFWWDGGDPLWITATRQNLRVNLYHWMGCQAEIRGLKPNFCQPYTGLTSLKDFSASISNAVNAMRTGKTDVSLIYEEMTDHYGHRFGPNATILADAINEIDFQINTLLTSLTQTNMADGSGRMSDFVNVMVVSDHGMMFSEKVINLTEIVDTSDVISFEDIDLLLLNSLNFSTFGLLWPKEGRIETVYNFLKSAHPRLTVMKKEDAPDRWHYQASGRISPLIIMSDVGWVIEYEKMISKILLGHHGYDPENSEMRGIFTAWGPKFKPGYRQKGIVNIDLYQVMCHILGLEASPNNGTWDNVRGMLSSSDTSPSGSMEPVKQLLLIIFVICGILLTALLLGKCIKRIYVEQSHKKYGFVTI